MKRGYILVLVTGVKLTMPANVTNSCCNRWELKVLIGEGLEAVQVTDSGSELLPFPRQCMNIVYPLDGGIKATLLSCSLVWRRLNRNRGRWREATYLYWNDVQSHYEGTWSGAGCRLWQWAPPSSHGRNAWTWRPPDSGYQGLYSSILSWRGTWSGAGCRLWKWATP